MPSPITPLTEGGHEYNLADVLVALHGPAKAAEILIGFAESPLCRPALNAQYIETLLSEAQRVSDI